MVRHHLFIDKLMVLYFLNMNLPLRKQAGHWCKVAAVLGMVSFQKCVVVQCGTLSWCNRSYWPVATSSSLTKGRQLFFKPVANIWQNDVDASPVPVGIVERWYLWHGTSSSAAHNICMQGSWVAPAGVGHSLRWKKNATTGGLHGKG